jgi:soluble lytic murein transglycosylase-like protein
MAAVVVLAVVSGAAQAVPATAPPPKSVLAPWRPYVAEASLRFSIPATWIEAVMRVESGGRTHLHGAPITSRAGAMGLMQLMPDTYKAMAKAHGLGADPHDPRDNILAGTAYLASMRARFGYPGAFAAYNAGPARYETHLRTGVPLPAETRAYIASLARVEGSPDLPPTNLAGQHLFYALTAAGSTRAPEVSETPVGGLFVPLSNGRMEP